MSPKPRRAKQRIRQCMGKRIAVRVAKQAAIVLNPDAAKNQRLPSTRAWLSNPSPTRIAAITAFH